MDEYPGWDGSPETHPIDAEDQAEVMLQLAEDAEAMLNEFESADRQMVLEALIADIRRVSTGQQPTQLIQYSEYCSDRFCND